jgi:hypothetical protein
MAKKTLLRIVQDILNDLDSDEVNSIDDTVESQQVATIVENVYIAMMTNRMWPHTRRLLQLESSGDISKPNYLKLPENLKQLDSFKYETTKKTDTNITIKDVHYKEPDDFLRYTSQRRSSDVNVQRVVDYTGTPLLVYKDTAPSYWTSFDDTYLITDAYDSEVDTTLQTSKTQCMAYIMPSWERSDTAVPDLPIDAFTALIEEAKSTASLTLKQMANQKAEQNSKRQQAWLSRKAWRAHGGVTYENYGRKGRR